MQCKLHRFEVSENHHFLSLMGTLSWVPPGKYWIVDRGYVSDRFDGLAICLWVSTGRSIPQIPAKLPKLGY